jgi:E3 ubiquitin-protein ligase RBBP6
LLFLLPPAEYRDNAFLIPRNSCLIVRRIPAIYKTPLGNAPQQSHAPTASQHTSGGSNLSAVLPSQRQAQEEAQQRASTSAAADAEDSALNRGEGDVLASMLQSAAEDWQKEQSAAPSFGQGRGRGGGAGRGGGGEGRGFGKSAMPPDPLRKPPRGYVCKRCGIPGHFVQNCPTIGNPDYDRASVKNQPQAAYGVPASRVECTEDGSGALVLPSGQRGNLKPEECAISVP